MRILILVWLVLLPASQVRAETARDIVVISDLHFGMGTDGDGSWYPNEDFRWPNALAAFLNAIDTESDRPVDLVIAGDFLDLWEGSFGRCSAAPGSSGSPTSSVERPAPKFGCKVPEMKKVAEDIVRAHALELANLAAFSSRNGNCLYVLAGNHDAALLLDEVWKPVADALHAGASCVQRPEGGLWTSADGHVLVEHGHLVPYDPNGYQAWPQITKVIAGDVYLEQPWGEHFVQRLFTQEERTYPLIDNLSPNSAGLRYRMRDRGLWGTATDLATFIRFNLLETSINQKVQVLSVEEGNASAPKWDVAAGRSLGHRLFLEALDPTDPFAVALRSDSSKEWSDLRKELDATAQHLPADEVLALCDQIALRGGSVRCREPEASAVVGAAIGLFSRQHVPASHVKARWTTLKTIDTWVYGHTHAFELEWQTEPAQDFLVSVLNDGAFQRVIDDERLKEIAKGADPLDFLKRSSDLSELPPCYTSVQIERSGAKSVKRVRAWHMEELGTGRFVDPCDPSCGRVGHGCPKGKRDQ